MQYKVNLVSPTIRDYETKYGPMKAYRLRLAGYEDIVELSQKDTTPAPVRGQTLEGTIEAGPYGPKFHKESPQFAKPTENNISQAPDRNSLTPDENKRQIVRQHSQEMALRHFANLIASKRVTDYSLEQLTNLTDHFERDVRGEVEEETGDLFSDEPSLEELPF